MTLDELIETAQSLRAAGVPGQIRVLGQAEHEVQSLQVVTRFESPFGGIFEHSKSNDIPIQVIKID